MRSEVVVVGAGPAGLATAARLAEAGRQVTLVARGSGFTHWGAGAVDVLARAGGAPVASPLDGIGRLPPDHPYQLVGGGALLDGLDWFNGFTRAAGLAHEGSAGANRQQVTALGTLRPTCLVPEPAAGALTGRVAVVGLAGFHDFFPALCARGLDAAGVLATPRTVALPPWPHQRHATAVELARALDGAGFRAALASRLARAARGAEVAVVPAVLGLGSRHGAWRDLEERAGLRLVEAALPPPSVPGLRLFEAYRRHLLRLGVRWQLGASVTGVERAGNRVTAVRCASAGHPLVIACEELVLATGGVAGHGIEAHRDGRLTETAAGLPVSGPGDRAGFFDQRFLADHPLWAAGVRVDAELRPAGADGSPLLTNARCVGSLLAGHDPVAEGSREGVALATAARAAALLTK